MKILYQSKEIKLKNHEVRLIQTEGKYILQLVKLFKNGKEKVIQGESFGNRFLALRRFLLPILLYRQHIKHNF